MRFDALPVGYRVGERYVVGRVCGRGRSAVVYEAEDIRTKTPVALKVLNPLMASDEVALERFRREVTAVGKLRHPGIVLVREFLVDGELRAIVMELVPGLNGREYLKKHGRLPVPHLLKVAEALIEAVQSCHRSGVLHRDLKPHNILIGDGLRVKLVDFGVAKLTTLSDMTRTGTVVGTPEYMAPEMFLATRADQRSDIYGLGATLYELATGRPPVPGHGIAQVMAHQRTRLVEPIRAQREDVPEWLDLVIRKCLALDPARRYQSCFELLHDLRHGHGALATREAGQASITCRKCRVEMIPGLAFCYACGTFVQSTFSPGTHAVVVNAVTDKREAVRHLARSFGVPPRRLAKSLLRTPRLLASGLSEETAGAIAQELYEYGCVLQVSKDLPREFRLSARYMPVAFAPVVGSFLMVLFARAPFWTLMGGIALGCAAAYGAFFLATQPLLDFRKRERTKAAQEQDRFLAWFAAELRAVKDTSLRHLLASLALHLARVARLMAATRTPGLDQRALSLLVGRCLGLAREVEGHEVYLERRTVNELREMLAFLDARLARAKGQGEAGPLIAQKAEVRAELRRFQEVQERHATMMVALLNLRGLLARLEEHLVVGLTGPELAAEVEELSSVLPQPPAKLVREVA